jgi:hypothetical protein
MTLARLSLALFCLVGGGACVAQNACFVTAFGAKGDCTTDDTAAFQQAADHCGSFSIPRPPGRCYRVNGVRLQDGVTVTFQDRRTEVMPVSAQTPYIFLIAGQSMQSRSGYTTIRGGEIWASFHMAPNTAGIRIEYGNHIRIEDMYLNGFYNDIFADNTEYLYLVRSLANGAAHANLWDQQSDVHHGPYFGGPLYIENSTLNSCACSAASIWVQDIAVVNVTDSDIVGVTDGQGFHADSSNGLPGTPPDYPDGIHLHGDTFDSIAGTPVSIHNYANSDIVGTWVSGGRTLQKSCIALDSVSDISLTAVHAFWCGMDGLVLGHTTDVKVTASNFSGTAHTGIHVVAGTRSMIFGNSCNPEYRNGNGSATQRFCIYEEASATGNRYIVNDAAGTMYGNSLHGTGSIVLGQ